MSQNRVDCWRRDARFLSFIQIFYIFLLNLSDLTDLLMISYKFTENLIFKRAVSVCVCV